ncbi:hypothetical protein AURDEDRAFT_176430 [Auricularia subglabra TFB-10046 SS5]|uniref:Uncharacterized protein n=1 Tax=Auricularia subglabra (strain TFB-10046 / SS5) TaxID=717982 RepID=J0D6P4_AURST|nr:hypothetical protein AURDEDRAFT_176430 [Auricularia subglabra TFB-10046 SS5]
MPNGASASPLRLPLVAYSDEDDDGGIPPTTTPPLAPADPGAPAQQQAGEDGRDYSPTVSPVVPEDAPQPLDLIQAAATEDLVQQAPVPPPTAAAYAAAASPMRPPSIRAIEETWTKGDRDKEAANASARSERTRRSIQQKTQAQGLTLALGTGTQLLIQPVKKALRQGELG